MILEHTRVSCAADVSTSFKRLQAEKLAADVVLREATPLESVKDAEGLREFFAQVKSKEQVSEVTSLFFWLLNLHPI